MLLRLLIYFYFCSDRESAETWTFGRIKSPDLQWGAIRGNVIHCCRYCHIDFLTGETSGFCCGRNGKYANDPPPLPPLPTEYDEFLNQPHVSAVSRLINVIFSFAALESSHEFPPPAPGGPAFVAMEGRLYHRIRPNHHDSSIRWLLYDGFSHDSIPHAESPWASKVPLSWIDTVKNALQRVNPFVHALQYLAGVDPRNCPTAHIRLHDAGPGNEIAAIFNYDNTTLSEVNARKSIVMRVDGNDQYIPSISRLWEPLAYPLFFPHGTLGWGVVGSLDDFQNNPSHDAADNDFDLQGEGSGRQIMFYRARILREPRFRIFGKLTNEYAVDMLSRNLETRLNYIRSNQKRLHEEDAELMGEIFVPDSQNIYLPASFMGSRRWATEQIADSLTIAVHSGNPTFFVTMTCNSEWPEISSRLRIGQDFSDIPSDVVRVFKQKLSLLEKALKTMFPNAGRMKYMIHSVEFQKRGLPHVHILCKYEHDCIHPSDIDAVVSAEMPTNPSDAELVRKLMLHHHPAADREHSRYCQRIENGRRICRFGYPQPLQNQTTVDSEGKVHYRRRKPGDKWVVPHCLPLLRMFKCHINFEAANPSHLFQYIFKYIHKSSSACPFALGHQMTLKNLSKVLIMHVTVFVFKMDRFNRITLSRSTRSTTT